MGIENGIRLILYFSLMSLFCPYFPDEKPLTVPGTVNALAYSLPLNTYGKNIYQNVNNNKLLQKVASPYLLRTVALLVEWVMRHIYILLNGDFQCHLMQYYQIHETCSIRTNTNLYLDKC